MIDADYVRLMARYNGWQNEALRDVVEAMSAVELDRDRGAFFGSIRATLNHLLWGDLIWMSRFEGGPLPDMSDQGVALTPTIAEWGAQRFKTDGRIKLWAERLRSLDLVGDLTWHSGTTGEVMTRPLAPLVVHFFNHQTHHRGQVHAMLTGAKKKLVDSDLFLMP